MNKRCQALAREQLAAEKALDEAEALKAIRSLPTKEQKKAAVEARKVERAEEAKKKRNTVKKKKKEEAKWGGGPKPMRSGGRKRPRPLPLAMPTAGIFHRGEAERPRTRSHSLRQ